MDHYWYCVTDDSSMGEGFILNPFPILSMLSVEITESQLLMSGLASGIAIVGVIIKWVVSSPEREAAAYKAGLADESTRCQEDMNELRQHALSLGKEIGKLRNALLRLAIASDLTITQRAEIAQVLGFPNKANIESDDKTLVENEDGDFGATN